MLEQFTQQLVKDESDNVQLKYDLSSNKVQISYCVTVLDKDKALEWLKKYRLPEFFKSGLYAEYKLSKILSTSQVMVGPIQFTSSLVKGSVHANPKCLHFQKSSLPKLFFENHHFHG